MGNNQGCTREIRIPEVDASAAGAGAGAAGEGAQLVRNFDPHETRVGECFVEVFAARVADIA